MSWTAFLIFRLVFSMVSWFDSSLTPSRPLLLRNTASTITVVNSERLLRKQDPCHVPRKSSGPSPAPSPRQSTACPGARASGLQIRSQLTIPDPVETRLSGVVISPLHPAPELVSETQISRQNAGRECIIRGSAGLMSLGNKVLLLCQKTLPNKGT